MKRTVAQYLHYLISCHFNAVRASFWLAQQGYIYCGRADNQLVELSVETSSSVVNLPSPILSKPSIDSLDQFIALKTWWGAADPVEIAKRSRLSRKKRGQYLCKFNHTTF